MIRKESINKQQKYEAKPHLGKIRTIDFRILKIKSFRHYQTDFTKKWVENCWDGELLIAENFYLRKEELDQQSLSQKQVLIENARSRYSNRTIILIM